SGEEVPGLFLAGGAQCEVVVGARRDAGGTGPVPVAAEVGVGEAGALGGLEVGEAHAVGADLRPVDLPLVAGDVDAHHLTGQIGRGEEGPGLFLAGGAQCEVVVGARRDAGGTGPVPVAAEVGVGEAGALGGLEVGEAHAVGADLRPVDLPLVAGDVDAHHLTG